MYAMRAGALSLAALLLACSSKSSLPPTPSAVASSVGKAAVNAARLAVADNEPGNWTSYGRTYDEQRFCLLEQIDARNVNGLHLAWHYDLDAARRAQETTPNVDDGVLYLIAFRSKVFALDPASGKELWVFDPAVPGTTGVKGCCDVGNRGVAVWNLRVYVGTFDGRLIALDALNGKQERSVDTVDAPGADPRSSTITGAPRVMKGKVIIGNAGGGCGARGGRAAGGADGGK